MNQIQLRSFVVIADHGSFSKAARSLHISTQALMQQIRLLERDLGVSLFNRSHQGVTLTQAGRHFYEGAKHILSYSESLRRECQETLSGSSGLRVGTSHEITPTFLYNVSYEFNDTYPQVSLNIVHIDSSKRFSELFDSKLDLCECFDTDSLEHYELEFYPVLNAQLYCIVSNKHPLAKRDSISYADLENQTILVSNSQLDYFGNPQVSHTNELGIIYKQYHNPTSKKLETALGNAVYIDYLFDTIDLNVFSAIPYTSLRHHTFGFAHRANPTTNVKRFLEVASKFRDVTVFY